MTVNGQVISAIQRGLLVLVDLSRTDTIHDCDYIARKLLSIKVWDTPDTDKPWTHSVSTLHLDVLLVSQFTLYAELKGNRPDFHTAMPPQQARQLYERFVAAVRKEYGEGGAERVKDGVFGADMKVALVNDGPVTIALDTDDKRWDKELAKQSRPFGGTGQTKNARSSPAEAATGEAVLTSAATSASASSSPVPATETVVEPGDGSSASSLSTSAPSSS